MTTEEKAWLMMRALRVVRDEYAAEGKDIIASKITEVHIALHDDQQTAAKMYDIFNKIVPNARKHAIK